MACAQKKCGCCCTKLLSVLVVVAAILTGVHFAVDRPENWQMDPIKLQDAAKRGMAAAGPNATATVTVDKVIAEVTSLYPTLVKNNGFWFFNNAGGAMGSMTILHCSLSEYLIIFGSALGTEGATGRFHFADDFFTILTGEQAVYAPESREKETYKPGEQNILWRGTQKQYTIKEGTFALEYARGNIPSMLPFGFADTFFSTLDFQTLYYTVRESTVAMVESLMNGKI